MKAGITNLHITLTAFRNESRVLKQTQSLVEKGIARNVFIHALHETGLLEREGLDPGRVVVRHTLRTRRLPRLLLTQIMTYLELTIRLTGFVRRHRVDLINVHALALLPLGVFLKVVSGARLVYDTHELETETDALRGSRKILAKWTERGLIRFADACIVVGEEIRQWYLHAYGIEQVVTVLNCPPYRSPMRSDRLRERLGIPSGQRIVLYMGGLSHGRGIELMLDAFDRVIDRRYALVVMGFGELEGLVRRYARRVPHIYFMEAVDPGQVMEYAASADIGAVLYEDTCANHRYCLPNKLFEYTMAGLPVVISDLIEMRRIVERHGNGTWIRRWDAEALSEALDVLSDVGVEKLRDNAREAARILNWESQEGEYVSAIAAVLK